MPLKKKEWIVTGLMSGTSLDGLDIATCRFRKSLTGWKYEIVAAETIIYSLSFKKKLAALMSANAYEYAEFDAFFGKYSGAKVKEFHSKHLIKADLIASHGHTIFHQPKKGFTSQIGNGAYIFAATGIPTVADFRSLDVALGGQGAPLVPIGDKLLFSEYDFCLNLGGIANISFDKSKKRIAGDSCPANIVLNKLAGEIGASYDKDGAFASKGKIDQALLTKFNAISYYKKPFPKSMGKEWIDQDFFPLLNKSTISTEDKLATVVEHIAIQVALLIDVRKSSSLFITGGGAFNKYLIDRIRATVGTKVKIVVPDFKMVSYKEALIFAFLGMKRVLGESTALSSVTGASIDSVGGALYGNLQDKN